MKFKVWNADAGKWVLNGLAMLKRNANALADDMERNTGDTHVVVPA